MPPEIANDMHLDPARRDGRRRGHVLVVAHRDHRTADAGAPQPGDDERRDDEHARGTGSTCCGGWRSRCGRSPAVRCAAWSCRTREPVNSGRRNSQFEHITANASVMTARNRPAHAQRRDADDDRGERRRRASSRSPPGNHAISKLHVPEVERHRDVVTGAQHDHRQRAEPDERELAERELAGPTRERRDRQRDRARRSRSRSRGTAATAACRNSGQDREEAEQHGEAEQRAGGGRTRATAAVPGSASPAPRATSPVSSRRLRTTNITSTSAATNR